MDQHKEMPMHHEVLLALRLALLGQPIAGVVDIEPKECVLWRLREKPLAAVTRPRTRDIIRLRQEDYDALFPAGCKRAYLIWGELDGKRQYSLEARVTEQP